MDDDKFKSDVMRSLGNIEGSIPPMTRDIEELQKEQRDQGKDLAAIKVKSSIFGTIGGMISGFFAGLFGS